MKPELPPARVPPPWRTVLGRVRVRLGGFVVPLSRRGPGHFVVRGAAELVVSGPRAVALFTLIVCVCMSVLLALALSRGPLRDSLPSFRGTLRASTSLGPGDVGFASKLAWDLVGYPLYIFLFVGLLLRVFSPQ